MIHRHLFFLSKVSGSIYSRLVETQRIFNADDSNQKRIPCSQVLLLTYDINGVSSSNEIWTLLYDGRVRKKINRKKIKDKNVLFISLLT